jgi:hypothetical protein
MKRQGIFTCISLTKRSKQFIVTLILLSTCSVAIQVELKDLVVQRGIIG